MWVSVSGVFARKVCCLMLAYSFGFTSMRWWQQAINLSAQSLFLFPKLFPQPPLCQHRSVIIVNSKAGWSMEMLNKAAGLLPQRLCETRFARRCVPLNISRKALCLLPSSPALLCAFRAPLLEVVLNSEFFTLSSKWSCFLRNGQPKGFSFSETERQWNP